MTNDAPVTKSNTIQERLRALKAADMSWRQIQASSADLAVVPVRTLWKIHETGKVPKKWREHFGLPELKPAPCCPSCGDVHTTKTCTRKRRKYRDLWAMPADELRRRLEERVIYDDMG